MPLLRIYKQRNIYYILDGVHRVTRAYQDIMPFILVQFVSLEQLKKASISRKELRVLGRKCQKY